MKTTDRYSYAIDEYTPGLTKNTGYKFGESKLKDRLFNFEIKLMTLGAVINRFFMLHMTQSTISIVWGRMRISPWETLGFFCQSRFIVTLNASGTIWDLRRFFVHILSVAGFTSYPFSKVPIGSEISSVAAWQHHSKGESNC